MEATIVQDKTKHYPVLLKEIISIITPQHGGTFIDCTFGQGGYTEKILDFKKNSGWIHRSQLKKSSSFITLDTVILFSDSTKFSRPIAKIESGRLLNKKKCNLNWCRVETGEYKGWVLKESLWGLN